MDLLSTYYGRADANTAFWMSFATVAFGVIGLQASGKAFANRLLTKSLLSIAFAIFAGLNYNANYDNEKGRESLKAYIEVQLKAASAPAGSGHLLAAVERAKPTESVEHLWKLHLFLSLVVLAGIWGLPPLAARSSRAGSSRDEA